MFRPKYLKDSKPFVKESGVCPINKGQRGIVEPTRGGEKGKDVLYMALILVSIRANMKAGSI